MFKNHLPVRCSLTLAVLSLLWSPACRAEEEKIPKITGPAVVPLGDHLAQISLPRGYEFIEKDVATQILTKLNGTAPDHCLGIVVPQKSKTDSDDNFFVVCSFEDIGHVKDEDADKLNSDELLKAFQDGCKSENEERQKQGVKPFFVGNWAEKPRYEKPKHEVIWGIEVKDEDSPSAPVDTINYNTRILGRAGVLSMNLVTSPNVLAESKQKAKVLLDDTKFVKGSAYDDFQAGKDKDSGIGIAGLILGGGALAAAAKFGVFGAMWKFLVPLLLAGKKLIILVIAGAGAFFAKFFGKKQKPQ